jgi:hypothetical protein
MTVEQYNKTAFTGGMQAMVDGKLYEVASADFEDKTFGLLVGKKVKWFPCEAVSEIKYKESEKD